MQLFNIINPEGTFISEFLQNLKRESVIIPLDVVLRCII